MALAKRNPRKMEGHAKPRLAPPRPLKSKGDELVSLAHDIGIDFIPAQQEAARYIEAVNAEGRHLYREIAIIESRQNGKTEMLVPHVVRRLLQHRRIMHTAQNRELPREVHGRVADIFESKYVKLVRSIRWANGQEEIKLKGGGHYRIVAPTRGGARGPANDDVLIDEVREMVNHDFIAAAKPTTSARTDPQIIYLSNMGDETSEVLNALKSRSEEDPNLAYLEWSARPDRAPDDVQGWLESNPGIGHLPRKLENLQAEYNANKLAGTMAVWETEFLCRKVPSMRERLVSDTDWRACEDPHLPQAAHPAMAVAMDPEGRRASAAIAWQLSEEPLIGVRVLYEAIGDPIDVAAFGKALKDVAMKTRVSGTAYDPIDGRELAKYLPNAKPMTGQQFAAGSQLFAQLTHARHLRWTDADALADDLLFTARKENDETGSFQAVRAEDGRPITAALAAIRAVALASGPRAPVTGRFIY